MSYKQIILVRKGGEFVPQEVLQNILENYKTCFGAALVHNDTLCTNKTVFKDSGPITAEFLKEMQEEFKESTIVMTFGQYDDAGFSQNACQPFELIEDQAAVFMSGTFEDTRDTKSRESAEYQAYDKYIKPKLERAFKAGGNDIDMVIAELRDSLTGIEINNFLKPDGSLVVMTKTNEVECFWNQHDFLQYSWGSISHGDVSQPAAEKAKEPETVKNKFTNMFKIGGNKPAAATETKTASVPNAGKKQEDKPVETASTKNVSNLKVASSKKMIQAPEGLSNKNIKQYYSRNAGYLPTNWKDRPIVESRLVKDLKELAVVNKQATAEVTPSKEATPEKKSDTAPTNIPEPDTGLPHVPAKEREAIVQKFMKKGTVARALAESREDILHPNAMRNLETEMPSFAEQIGLKAMTDVLGFSFEDFKQFSKEYPDSVPVLIHSLRNELLKAYSDARASAAEGDKTPVKEEHTASAPSKKFGFKMGGLKKAAM